MTLRQTGSADLGHKEIRAKYSVESANSPAKLNDCGYCMESEDAYVTYNKSIMLKVIELFCKISPIIVFIANLSDYIIYPDVASKLAIISRITIAIPNIKIDGSSQYPFIPYLFYCEPTMGLDVYGNEIKRKIPVDIREKIDINGKMLVCHKSQHDWLLKIYNFDD